MIDPDRCIDQDHLNRRRGGALRLGWVPPIRASRRALSRWIKAFSASLISADFSRTPVNSCALAITSSSSATVVRIVVPPPEIGTDISSIDAQFHAGGFMRPLTTPENIGRA